MRKASLFGLFATIIVASTFIFLRTATTKEHQPKTRNKLSKQDRIDLAISQEVALTKDPALNTVPRERLLQAADERNQRFSRRSLSAVPDVTWQERGPNNVGGRTRALIFDLNDAANGYKKVWAGGVGGGLWFTNDISVASPSWNKINDMMENLAITTLAQNPANTQEIYAGTGEGWTNIDAIRGLGIWKTSNGGTSWTQLPSTNNSTFYYVQKIAISSAGHLYACTRGGGLQKSVDGGASWTKILGSGVGGGLPGNTAINNDAADIEIAANGDLYCSFGIFSTGKIYRSSDAGANWTDISPVAGRRIELACAPSDANTIYALFHSTAADNNCTAIQRYDASTNTWTAGTVPTIIDQGSNSNFTRGQAWYDLIATVDPNNANSLYIGGVDALRSDNGGTTWTQMTTWSLYGATGFGAAQNVHADHHAIVYAPGSSSTAIWGTDGGIYYTTNANIASSSKPTFAAKNSGYNVTQYYGCAIHPTNTNYFLAGAQDNGSHKFTAAGLGSVTSASGGDGAFCHIDQDNPNIQITSYVFNNYYISTNGGGSFNSVFFNNVGGFINPTDYDDLGNILYGGNSGGSYFRWNNPATGGNSGDNVSCPQFSGGAVTHVAVSPSVGYRVYFGLSNGSVVRVNKAHAGTSVTGTVIRTGTGSVSGIAVDVNNENHMLVSYSNYGVTSVFESFNANSGSPTWTPVEGNLPDMPVRWVMFDPRNNDWALIATELGVWSTDNLNGSSTDWQPTNSGFANVRVDMLQYRSSDRTIAAATHGRGLFTAVLPPPTNPSINFQNAASLVGEQTVGTIGCRGYRDITVNVGITSAPVGDAIVSYSVQSGGSAVQGVDYDFTTNGDFSNPSTTHSFQNGSAASGVITLRIFDDAEVEDLETLTISYTVSGSTNAVSGSGAQLHTVTIRDNDFAPAPGGIGTSTVGAGNYTGGYFQPFRSTHAKAKSQYIYLASELTAAGVAPGNITALAYNVLSKGSNQPYSGLTISLKHTTASSFSGTIFETGAIQCYSGNYTTSVGTNTFNFTVPFTWDGTSNLLVEICFDNVSAFGTGDNVSSNTTSDAKGLWNRDNVGTGCSLAGNYAGVGSPITYVRPDIILTGNRTGTAVETVLNSSKSVYVAPNNDVYYYNGTKIMARLRNLSAHNFDCAALTIDRAGVEALPFWNNTPANYLMSKTFRVVPTTNNASGQYEITLYFSNAEKIGWEAATGQSWNNIKIIKVPGQISDYSPGTIPNASSIEVVTPTIGTFGSDHTLTYTFNTGFSGFGAGIPGLNPLPVSLIDFKGVLQGKHALLTWSTSSEQNSKNFELEKSTDGVNYYQIGRVAAAGNSTSKTNYSLFDKQVATLNYYRLKMNDFDGRFKHSQVVVIRSNTNQTLWVVNNPFKNHIDVRLAVKPNTVRLQLINVNGAFVTEKIIANPSEQIRWDLQNVSLSKGTYLLRAIVDGTSFTEKLVKE